jgi:uncharacterized protein YqjF (DUF2071 family)
VTTVDLIDRIAPTREPDSMPLLHQNWLHLLFLHWEVPADELQRLLPPELTVDTFEGKAYIGLVPFTMTGVRPTGVPALPWISSFHEINVRTYVHRKGADPGVWFFSLDASSPIAVAAARAAYKLSYFFAEIEFSATTAAMPEITFRSHREDPRGAMPAHAHIRYSPIEGPILKPAPGSLEFFLVERYILYSMDEAHRLYRARVHHQPYPIRRADVAELDETLIWASGIKRSDAYPIRHYASEVNVKIYGLEQISD